MASQSLQRMGGNLAPWMSSFSLDVSTSSYKILHQLIHVDFLFHCAYLGFRKQWIRHCTHCKECGEVCTIIVDLFI
jgi:hypothetical protein